MTSSSDDIRHMRHALSLGRRGLGLVWPNPAVGCVLVKEGRILARGWTQEGGRPHAEAMALEMAGTAAHGSTAYVTLEPCSHHGKTPPCAQSLIDAGVVRVVCALGDPDPRVSGRGFDMLEAAGIEVVRGVGESRARRDQLGFLNRITQNRPLVTLKLAMTWDGRIATATGESQWITGPKARHMVHGMRAQHDAVMVGGGTARADDPELTVRGLGVTRQPVRVVLSRKLDMPRQSRLTHSDAPLWLLHGDGVDFDPAWTKTGAELLPVPVSFGQLDITAAMAALAGRGLTRVFCEGGGALAASLLSADLVDRVVLFTAGFGMGAEGLPGIGALGRSGLKDIERFRLRTRSRLGEDLMSIWER